MRDQRRSPLRVVRTERSPEAVREEDARQRAYWDRMQALRDQRDRLRAG